MKSVAKRKNELEAKVARFLQQYGRKAQKGQEPNDRRFDRKVQGMIKRMKPDELDRLLREADERGDQSATG